MGDKRHDTKLSKSEAVEQITALRRLGLSSRVIAARLGLSKSRICTYCQQFGIPKWPDGRPN